MADVHPDILKQAKKVTGKRPLTVINHILEHGQITSQELKDIYGYNHPPRAIRDVRECGIPIETKRIVGSDGRKIAAYTFGDPSRIEHHKLAGRRTFSKAFKKTLIEINGAKCAITGEPFQSRYLSIDHRIPYEIAGDSECTEDSPEGFMLISAAAQRQKSWSCENCPNFKTTKNYSTCETCYWASPESYEHIATEQRRRVDLHWIDGDVKNYERLVDLATQKGLTLAEYIKSVIESTLK